MKGKSVKISRKQATIIVFVLTTALALINLVQSTVNYVQFYTALKNLELQPLGIDFTVNQENLNVTLEFKLRNPTGYNGFFLRSIHNALQYEGDPHEIIISHTSHMAGTPYQEAVTTLWDLTFIDKAGLDRTIQPYSTIKFTITKIVRRVEATPFVAYYEKIGSNKTAIKWILSTQMFLDTPTFLNTLILEYQFAL